MKKMLMLIVLLLILSTVWAESVILNDGRTLKGEIVGKKGDSIYLRSDGNIYLLTRDLVKQIKNDGNQSITKLTYKKKNFVDEGVDLSRVTQLVLKNKDDSINMPVAYNMQKTHKTKMNWKPAALSVLFGAMAWDYFATAGDLNNSIESLKDMEDALNIDLSKDIKTQEKQKTRKIINGSLLSAASVVSFAVSFENVEIKASSTSLEVGYKF